MAKLGIQTGSFPNDGTGDTLLTGAFKINSNFNEIYNAIGDGTVITNSIGYATTSGISTTSRGLFGSPNLVVGVVTTTGDVRVGINTSNGLVLTSPNGIKYRLIVNNSGVLSTIQL